MSSRKQLQKLIEKEEQTICSLRSDIKKLEGQIQLKTSYVQGLTDSLKYLPKADNGSDAPVKLREGSEIATARDILLKAGKALHVSEILKLMGKEASKNHKTSASGYLSAYARKGLFFKKTAPNTFCAIEIEAADQSATPPDDFGMENKMQKN
jgi:hypothetical protein